MRTCTFTKRTSQTNFPFNFVCVGIPHEFVRSDLNHETILNDERIPELLQRMVDQVVDAGLDLLNPLHPRL